MYYYFLNTHSIPKERSNNAEDLKSNCITVHRHCTRQLFCRGLNSGSLSFVLSPQGYHCSYCLPSCGDIIVNQEHSFYPKLNLRNYCCHSASLFFIRWEFLGWLKSIRHNQPPPCFDRRFPSRELN